MAQFETAPSGPCIFEPGGVFFRDWIQSFRGLGQSRGGRCDLPLGLILKIMKRSIKVDHERNGAAPQQGAILMVSARIPAATVGAIDEWAKANDQAEAVCRATGCGRARATGSPIA